MKRLFYSLALLIGVLGIGISRAESPVGVITAEPVLTIPKEVSTFQNLIRNGSFESALNGTSPDGWTISQGVTLIDLDGTDRKAGHFSLLLKGPATVTQGVDALEELQGTKVVFGAWVKATQVGEVTLILDDGKSTQSVANTLAGEWEFLTKKVSVSDQATKIDLIVNFSLADDVLIDGVVLNQLTKSVVFTSNPSDDIKMPSDLIYTDTINGKVGIGTSTPQKELDVAGDIRASGNIYTGEEELMTRSLADSKYLNANQSDLMEGTLTIDGSLNVSDEIKEDGDRVLTEPAADSRYVDLKGGDTILGDLILNGLLTSTSGKILQDLEVTGLVKANRFEGDGSGLTNILSQWKSSSDGSGIYFDQGNVGIGTTSPLHKLHVQGNIMAAAANGVPGRFIVQNPNGANPFIYGTDNGGGQNIQFRNSEETATRMYMDMVSGNVGIGTTSPSTTLHISKDAGAGHMGIRTSNPSTASNSYTEWDAQGDANQYFALHLYPSVAAGGGYLGITDKSKAGLLMFYGGQGAIGTYTDNDFFLASNDTARITIKSSGNVGIGTTSPQSRLTVNGSITNNYNGAYASAPDNNGFVNVSTLDVRDSSGGATNRVTHFRFNSIDEEGSPPQSGFSSRINGYYGQENIGFDSRLHYFYPSSYFFRAYSESESKDVFSVKANTNRDSISGTRADMYVSGNVGIGTTSPDSQLDLNGSFEVGTGSRGVRLSSSAPDNFQLQTWTNTPNPNFFIGVGDGAGGTSFRWITGSGTNRNIFLAPDGGNVGIGTESPREKLEVAGNIYVTGNINAKYQDVAEWVASEEELTPGTVVVIDSDSYNKVVASNSSYDSKVCGVVSYQPGLSLGEKGENKYQIAHTGRVKVKVNASFGKISQGDLLVTSPQKGTAMKYASDGYQPGVILGKALESLGEGEGEILVLLSLQ